MEEAYPIYFANEKIGSVELKKEGLYCRVYGKCTLTGSVTFMLKGVWKDKTVPLGVFVPEGKFFIVSTRIPLKRLGEGQVQFFAEPKHSTVTDRFVPLSPQEPCKWITRLSQCSYEVRFDQPGLVLTDRSGGPQGSDQIP